MSYEVLLLDLSARITIHVLAMRVLILFVAAMLFGPFLMLERATAGAYVAPEWSLGIWADERLQIGPGRYTALPFAVPANSSFDVRIDIFNQSFADLSVWVCDEISLQRYKNGQPNNCRGYERRKRRIEFRWPVTRGGTYYLVLDNTYASIIKKSVGVSLRLIGSFSEQSRAEMEVALSEMAQEFNAMFNIPEIDFSIRPCGTVNAYSERKSGNITICSELLVQQIVNRRKGSFLATVAHEFGHSLLNHLGLPGWDNEDTVDEFATVFLFWAGQQQAAVDWIKDFREADSRAQAQRKLIADIPHELSIQRARNVERVLRNPHPVVARWNRLLYPHLTGVYLRRITGNPGAYHDRALAEEELARRNDGMFILKPPAYQRGFGFSD